MTDPNNGYLGYRPLWHWINTLFGRHDRITAIEFKHSAFMYTVTAWHCETCGHGWIETRRK